MLFLVSVLSIFQDITMSCKWLFICVMFFANKSKITNYGDQRYDYSYLGFNLGPFLPGDGNFNQQIHNIMSKYCLFLLVSTLCSLLRTYEKIL